MFVRKLLDLIGIGSNPDEEEVEIVVLRHQRAVLRRQVARPRLSPSFPRPETIAPNPLDAEVVALVVRLARESQLGYLRIGELKKVGVRGSGDERGQCAQASPLQTGASARSGPTWGEFPS